MLNILKGIFAFKMGQSSARGAARMVGLGRLGVILGLIGGYRAYRRHRMPYRTI
ncbi:MAG TPA: hypothetical protein VE010_14925 [Thermoanaerobaculia bacterium]|nr:hypothetical protein [Thermoanaerobaculia bacterium]